MQFVHEYLMSCWWTLLQMAPALLLGFLAAGVIAAFISEGFVSRHLGGKGLGPVAKAALLGVPMPLCSCGVLPVAAALKRSGASRGALAAFLISVPQTGADNIFVVWSLLGLAFAIYSPVSAFLSGLFGGAVCEYFGGSGKKGEAESGPALNLERPGRNPLSILRYSFVTIVDDLAGSLLLGLAIAGLVSVAIPEGWIADHVGPGVGAMFLMLLVGIPLYVCSSGSVPIAAAFMAKGASPGAALVFLITGPASNAAGIAAISKMLGLRTAFLYIASLVVFAFGSGLLMNWLFGMLPEKLIQAPAHVHGEGGASVLQISCAAVLLALIGISLLRGLFGRKSGAIVIAAGGKGIAMLKIEGMTCKNCVKAVEAALKKAPNVAAVEVDLKGGVAYVRPAEKKTLNIKALESAVVAAGYSCSALK